MPTKENPSYLFLGEETFLKEDAVNTLVSKHLGKSTKELNYKVFYAKERSFDIKEMFDFLTTLPFLSKKRVVILKEAQALSISCKESILNYLKEPQNSSVFIMESSSPVIKGGFLLEASKLAHLVYFRKLRDVELDNWIVKKVRSYNKKIDQDAVIALKESLENDLRIISSNLENVALYTGKRAIITKSDVEKVIGVNPSHTAFDLMEAIRKKNVKDALTIFSSLKKDGKKEIELIGLLGWNARMLIRVKELARIRTKQDIARDLSLNPRALDAILNQSSRFKKKEALDLLREILKADLEIKSGSIPKTVIERLVVRMCSA
ncbi:MAG: DNA polymerase III subunit delta [Candidatus Omnitrophota bacterium]